MLTGCLRNNTLTPIKERQERCQGAGKNLEEIQADIMINKSPTAPRNRSERKEDLWDLAEHLRSAEGHTGLASEG